MDDVVVNVEIMPDIKSIQRVRYKELELSICRTANALLATVFRK